MNPLLGRKWYQGFWNRHGHRLEKKKGQKFSKDRSEWSIHQNFVQMYDKVYERMELAEREQAERLRADYEKKKTST
jgi:hypothetical protein